MGKPGDKYRPSNGTEGACFSCFFCENCMFEKYIHTCKEGDLQCNILNRAWLLDINDENYPSEWTYDAIGNPICTKWISWNWEKDDDDNWNDPPEPDPIGPNQLLIPFPFEDLFPFEKIVILENEFNNC